MFPKTKRWFHSLTEDCDLLQRAGIVVYFRKAFVQIIIHGNLTTLAFLKELGFR